MAKRKPDFTLAALNKRTNEKGWRVGSAWINEDGSIAITVDAFIVLPGGPDMLFTLFPYDEKRHG